MIIDFYAFVSENEEAKIRLGIEDDPESVDALRNKGGLRTEAKRAMLRDAAERARSVGRNPIKAYF